MQNALTNPVIPGMKPLRRGKVRDLYDLGDAYLIVATDRISAFDFVLPSGIPGKGKILTALSLFWFQKLHAAKQNHLITADVARMGDELAKHKDVIAGRSMLVKKATVVPIECIVRGYLTGSGWKEYQKSGTVCGIKLPAGLVDGSKLPEPIFTPSTKPEVGHDENISFERAVSLQGREVMEELRDRSLALYTEAANYAAERGIIICDTKFEWGVFEGEIILVDEVLTPDSSRFWPSDLYKPGHSQPSFDKQFVRDWLERESGWDKKSAPPELPPHVIEKTAEKYLEAYKKLTGKDLSLK